MKRLLAVVALAAGCSKSPATCKDVGAAVVVWGKDEVATEKLVGDSADKRARLFALTADLYPRVCESSKWAGATIDCLIAAKTEDEAQKCPLTKDQREDLQKALMDALAKQLGPAPAGGAAKPQ